MKQALADIQSGKFVKDWLQENRVNQTSFKAMRAKCDAQKSWASVYPPPSIAERVMVVSTLKAGRDKR
jgi:hypothetical protein